MRLAYLDCIGGVAGDMFIGALVDAGASVDRLKEVPAMLGLNNVDLDVRRVERHGIGSLTVEVVETQDAGSTQSLRRYAEIRERIGHSTLPTRARERSLDAFRRLAEVEGKVHGIPVDEVHFHELGAVDTLVDICGAMTLLDDLDVDKVACSPLPYSRGLISAAHGTLPTPAPATLELLVGAPLVGIETEGELVTPTGAVITATVVDTWGLLPPLELQAVGYGAGSRDLADRPNLVRVILGTTDAMSLQGEVALLETNLDDLNPEFVPDAVERCFGAGALDVWTAPAQMKKGRPGVILSAITRPGQEAEVARAMFEETSTLGIRVAQIRRYELEREVRTVTLNEGKVRVKLGRLDGRLVSAAPEHDDCAALARSTGRSVKEIWAAALAAVERL
jgi:pyridinium-3,5-bisthiocarboxylic acid mononucleotide nickel chelatase